MSEPAAPTPDDIERLCRDPIFVARFGEAEAIRRQAARAFLRTMGNVAVVAALAAVALVSFGWWPVAIPAFVIPLAIALLPASVPLGEARAVCKRVLLASLADAIGLSLHDPGRLPPAFEGGRATLFGPDSYEMFDDLIEGGGFFFWRHRAGRPPRKIPIFAGRFHLFPRSGAGPARMIVAPAGHRFGALGPELRPVEIPGDRAFSRRFGVHATDPADAVRLLDGEVRAFLVRLHRRGPVFVHLDRGVALVGVSGGAGFDPGTMLLSRGGGQRLSGLAVEFGEAIALQTELTAKLG